MGDHISNNRSNKNQRVQFQPATDRKRRNHVYISSSAVEAQQKREKSARQQIGAAIEANNAYTTTINQHGGKIVTHEHAIQSLAINRC